VTPFRSQRATAHLRLSAAGLSLAAIAGCRAAGSGGDAGEPDAPYVEETCTPAPGDAFCGAYASAYCAAHFACCTDPENRYASMALCMQRTTCLCVHRREGAAIDSGRVVFDSTAADALVARLESGAMSCAIMDAGALLVDEAFRGTLAVGADCSPTATDFSNLFACGPGSYCYVSDFGDETTPPVASCRAQAAAGSPCDLPEDCAPGTYCGPGATIDDPGVCTALSAGGVACADDFQCASDTCDEVSGTCLSIDADDTYCVDATLEPTAP
jgi:hypothetical protein